MEYEQLKLNLFLNSYSEGQIALLKKLIRADHSINIRVEALIYIDVLYYFQANDYYEMNQAEKRVKRIKKILLKNQEYLQTKNININDIRVEKQARNLY